MKLIFIMSLLIFANFLYALDNKHFELALKFEKLSSSQDKVKLVNKMFPAIKQYANLKNTDKYDLNIKEYIIKILDSKEYKEGKAKVYMDLYTSEELMILIKHVQSPCYKILNKQRANIAVGSVKNIQNI